MTLYLVIFFVMVTFFLLMSIGMIIAKKPIKGTCASLSRINIGGPCEICGSETQRCKADEK